MSDLRSWIEKLEVEGELKRIKAKVGWDGEVGRDAMERVRLLILQGER